VVVAGIDVAVAVAAAEGCVSSSVGSASASSDAGCVAVAAGWVARGVETSPVEEVPVGLTSVDEDEPHAARSNVSVAIITAKNDDVRRIIAVSTSIL